jgi:hypothetical protein
VSFSLGDEVPHIFIRESLSFKKIIAWNFGTFATISAMYGRRPRCKGKESDFFAKRSGAAMYPAFECSRLAAGPDVIR